MKEKMQFILKKQFRGVTMEELLVVMIVSGILFLFLFDGLSIVQRYGRILDRKFSEKSGLLYSHQILETLFEKTDSIRRNEDELLFHTRGDAYSEQLYVDSVCMKLYRPDYTDTLFRGLTDVEIHFTAEGSFLVDSLHISIPIGSDTIRLGYGLSDSGSVLNEYKTDDTAQW